MRTKKAVINATTSILYQLTMIICGLITPRLILNAFGSTYNGVIQSATQFLGMISILTLGLAGATRVALYRPLAEGNEIEISKIMLSTKAYLHKVGYAVLLFSIGLMFFYPLFSHNDLNHIECALIIGIISIGTFANYFFGVANQTLLMADQSSYVSDITSTIATILNAIITVILIRFGCTIFIVKLGSSIIYFLSPFVLNLYIKKKYSLRTDVERDDSVLNKRKAVMFHSIANIVHQNTDMFLLTVFTDAKIISVYSVYYLVVGKIRTLLNSLTSGMEAALGNMWAKEERNSLNTAFGGIEFLCYSFSIIVFSCVAVLLVRFVQLYTIRVTDINYIRPSFAVLITLAEILYCIRQPYLCLVQAAGFYNETKIGAIVEAAVNVIVSLILVNFIGLNGVVIGTIAANCIRTGQYAYFVSKRILNRKLLCIFKRVLWLLITMCTIIATCVLIVDKIYIQNWISLIISGFVTLVVSLIVWIITSLLFYRSDFTYIYNRLCGLVRKRV